MNLNSSSISISSHLNFEHSNVSAEQHTALLYREMQKKYEILTINDDDDCIVGIHVIHLVHWFV